MAKIAMNIQLFPHWCRGEATSMQGELGGQVNQYQTGTPWTKETTVLIRIPIHMRSSVVEEKGNN